MNSSSSPLIVDQLRTCLARLLPEISGLQLQQVETTEEGLVLVVKATASERTCPVCGGATTRVQSRYQRTLQDLPWGGFRVQLRLLVRRFFCSKGDCPRQIFTERLPDLTQVYARQTNRLRDVWLEVGWAKGGWSPQSADPEAADTLHAVIDAWDRHCRPI